MAPAKVFGYNLVLVTVLWEFFIRLCFIFFIGGSNLIELFIIEFY